MRGEPRLITLRTGARVPEPVVKTVRLALGTLMQTHPIAFVEAVAVARDPGHRPFGGTGAVLTDTGLLDRDGIMHSATRDTILACTDVFPVAPEACRLDDGTERDEAR